MVTKFCIEKIYILYLIGWNNNAKLYGGGRMEQTKPVYDMSLKVGGGIVEPYDKWCAQCLINIPLPF